MVRLSLQLEKETEIMSFRNVLVLGAASWNKMIYVPDLPQGSSATILDAQEVENVGSTGVGKSMVLAALGCKPTLHCALGRDNRGSLVTASCEERGISLIIDEQDTPTPHHLNIMDQKGGRYSLILSNGSPEPEIDEARIATAIQSATTIFLSLSNSSKELLHLLADANADVLLDLHDYDGENPWYDDFIACADVIQLSNVTLPDPMPVINQLLDGRASQIVLTKAEQGAEIFSRDGRIYVAPCPATMLDSNGAGDAFSVALWYAQETGIGLPQAGDFAAAAAALAIESWELFPSDVSVEDIQRRSSKL